MSGRRSTSLRSVRSYLVRSCALLVCLLLPLAAHAEPPPDSISVAYCEDCVPFQYRDEADRPAGIIIDLWRLWSEKTGIEVRFIAAPWDRTLALVRIGEADAHAGLFRNEIRDRYLDYGVKLTRTDTHVFLRQALPAVRKLGELAAYRIGVLSGDFVEGYLKQKLPGVNIVAYPTYDAIMTDLAAGSLMAFAADTPTGIHHLSRVGLLTDFRYPDSQQLYQNDWFVAVGEGDAALLEAINTGMALISDEERRDVSRRGSALELAEAGEQAIIVAMPRDDAPLASSDAEGHRVGLLVDLWNLWADRTGRTVRFHASSREGVISLLQTGVADVHIGLSPFDEPPEGVIYAAPILTLDVAVYHRADLEVPATLDEFGSRPVGVVAGSHEAHVLRVRWPGLVLRLVASREELLQDVVDGELTAAVSTTPGMIAAMSRMGLYDEVERQPVPVFTSPLHAALSVHAADLKGLLKEGFGRITSEEVEALEQRWLSSTRPAAEVRAGGGASLSKVVGWLIAGGVVVFVAMIVLMRRMNRISSDDVLAQQFGSARFRTLILVALSLFIAVVVGLGILAMAYSKQRLVDAVAIQLAVVRDAAAERLDSWVEQRRFYLGEFARDTDLRRYTQQLLDLPAERDALLASSGLEGIRTFFRANEYRFGRIGFFIIDEQRINVGSRRDTNIGAFNVIAEKRPDLIDRVFAGETVLIPPIRSDVVLEEGAGSTRHAPPTMFFAAPIRDDLGRVIAVLTQRINPGEDFSRVLQASRMGESGESYAFDRDGLMLSDSRFDDMLRQVGLIEADQMSMLNVQIRDPGGNMLDGHRPQHAVDARPLTRMAASAVRGERGVDTNGYRDYRGVPVFGAWEWGDRLGMGITAEIDVSEALAPYHTNRLLTFGIMGVTLLFAVGATLFTLTLGQRAHASLSRSRDELEGRVADRTRELHDSEQRIRSVLETIPDGVITIDAKGVIESHNPALTQMFGYGDESLIGRNISELMPEPDRGNHDSYLDRYAQTGEARLVGKGGREVIASRRDQCEFPVELSVGEAILDEVHLFTGVIRDITERKAADESMRKLSQAVEQSPAAVIITDTKGVIEYVNPQFGVIFGRKGEEVIGQVVRIFRPEHGEDPVYAEIRRTIGTGEEWRGELHNIHKDGRSVWVSASISGIRDEHGEMGHYLAVEEDITERKEADRILKDALEVISGSIQYASRIQRSILPPDALLAHHLPEHFVVWEPRDVVGGDAYWFRPWGSGLLVIVADCTGHGVPGAFMTLIANGALDMAQGTVPTGDPAALLESTHRMVQTALGQDGTDGVSDDGLELGACYIAPGGSQLVFAGARFSLFHARGGNVDETKGDRSGIGYRNIARDRVFTNHEIDPRPGSRCYLLTDGLLDQIGGAKRLGFGKRRLVRLLASLEEVPLADQGALILQALRDYQDNEKTRDDITLLGFTMPT